LLHRAPCPCVSADELTMLQLIATQQTGPTGLAARLAGGLVEHGAIGPLLEVGRGLARSLGSLGLTLPRRPLGQASPAASARMH
jgi:hypothetical protein